MRTVRIDGADEKPLGAPEDWRPDQGHCGALFIRREVVDGSHFMSSAWVADPNEAARAYAGAPVILGVQGVEHPVVNMHVGALPPDFDPVLHARRFHGPDGRPMVRVEIIFPHQGGRRGYVTEHVDGTLAVAVAAAITKIEQLARREGWIE